MEMRRAMPFVLSASILAGCVSPPTETGPVIETVNIPTEVPAGSFLYPNPHTGEHGNETHCAVTAEKRTAIQIRRLVVNGVSRMVEHQGFRRQEIVPDGTACANSDIVWRELRPPPASTSPSRPS